MSSVEASWLKCWELVSSIGFFLVIIGCIIEGVEHFHKFRKGEARKRHFIEKIGWLILIGGLAMEFLGGNRAKRISERENVRLSTEAANSNERAGIADRKAGEANERAAEAMKQAGKANERAAITASNSADLSLLVEVLRAKNTQLEATALQLEQQIAQTSNNVVRVNPLNQPIKSLKADLYLVVKGTNEVETILKTLPPVFTPKTMDWAMILPKDFVFGKDTALASLRCTEYESHPHSLRPLGPKDETEYSMSFNWPSGRMDDAGFLWLATNNASANALDEKMGCLEIAIVGVKPNSEIVEGSCILTVNGSIQKRFSIPKKADSRIPVLRFLPVVTNRP